MGIDDFSGGLRDNVVGENTSQGTPPRCPVTYQPLADPQMHGLVPSRGPVPETARRTSPGRHRSMYESGSTQRLSALLYDVSQTSPGRATSRAVRWANHVSCTCICPPKHTGHRSDRGCGLDAVAVASTGGLVSEGSNGACPRSCRHRGSLTLRSPFAQKP